MPWVNEPDRAVVMIGGLGVEHRALRGLLSSRAPAGPGLGDSRDAGGRGRGERHATGRLARFKARSCVVRRPGVHRPSPQGTRARKVNATRTSLPIGLTNEL